MADWMSGAHDAMVLTARDDGYVDAALGGWTLPGRSTVDCGSRMPSIPRTVGRLLR